ncbi:hypothetical protein ACLB2K_057340 [Fragaria x ananassa]
MATETMEEGLLSISSADQEYSSSSSSSVTSVVVLSTLVALCGSLSTGCATGYSSAAESGIVEDLDLTPAAYSVFGSIMTIGGVIGSLMNGRVTDLIGRRGAMWLSAIFSTAGWLTIAFAQNALWLDIGRLSVGFSIGIIYYVLMISCGFSLFYLIGNAISWRTMAAIGSIPGVLQIVALFFIPESPRWLVSSIQSMSYEEWLKLVDKGTLKLFCSALEEKNADISQEAAEIMYITEIFQQESETLMDLFQKRYAYSLIIGVGLLLLQQFGGANAVAYYGSSIFEDASFSSSIGTITLAIIG